MTNTLDLGQLAEKDFRMRPSPATRGSTREQQFSCPRPLLRSPPKKAAPGPTSPGLGAGARPAYHPDTGTKRRKYLQDNAGAVEISLEAADFQDIEDLRRNIPMSETGIMRPTIDL